MNLLLAVGILAGLFYFGMDRRIGLSDPPVVSYVAADSPAGEAGIRAGDRIVAVGGDPVGDWRTVLERVMVRPDEELVFEVEREGVGRELPVRVRARGPDDVGDAGVYPPAPPIIGFVEPGAPAAAAGASRRRPDRRRRRSRGGQHPRSLGDGPSGRSARDRARPRTRRRPALDPGDPALVRGSRRRGAHRPHRRRVRSAVPARASEFGDRRASGGGHRDRALGDTHHFAARPGDRRFRLGAAVLGAHRDRPGLGRGVPARPGRRPPPDGDPESEPRSVEPAPDSGARRGSDRRPARRGGGPSRPEHPRPAGAHGRRRRADDRPLRARDPSRSLQDGVFG